MKLFLASAFLLAIHAFTAQAQIRIGATVGTQSASQQFRGNGISISTNGILTGHLGVVAEYGITESIVFRPQFLFTGKGGKLNLFGSSTRTTMTYAELPLHVVYKHEIGPGRVLVGGGPYLGLGLMGRHSDNSSVRFGNRELDDYRRTEVGFGLLGGYELTDKNISFNLFYNRSLSSIDSDLNNNVWLGNRVWGVSLTYFFLNPQY